MSNHTLGPWEAYEDGRRPNLLPAYSVQSCAATDVGGDPVLVCENVKGKNAALIAAAPEMLEALTEVEYYAGENLRPQLRAVVLAAIAKAEGKV